MSASLYDPQADQFVGHQIVDDTPGVKLRIQWQGRSPRTLGRIFPLALMLVIFAFGGGLLWFAWGQEIAAAWAGNPNAARLPVLGFVLLIAAIMAYKAIGVALKLGGERGFWQELTWDQDSQEFTGIFLGTPLLGRRVVKVPFRDLSEMRIVIGPEGGAAVSLELTIYNDDIPDVTIPLLVEHVDRRVEAMDLLLRMGRIVGLTHYMVGRNTHRYLDVFVKRNVPSDLDDEEDDFEDDDDELEEDDDEGDDVDDLAYKLLPIPEDRSFARYASNDSPTGFQQPQLRVAQFNPEKLATEVAFTKLIAWDPGRLVHIHRPAWPSAAVFGVPLAGGMAIGLAAAWPLLSVVKLLLQPAEPAPWMIFIGVSLFAAIALYVYFRPNMLEREVVFDWTRGAVRWKDGSASEEHSLGDIEGFSLGGVRTAMPGKKAKSSHEYRAQLQMSLRDRDVAVMETDFPEGNFDLSFQRLLPLTVALARSLNVPWYTIESASPLTTSGGVSVTRGSVVLAAVATVLLCGWLAWQGAARYLSDTQTAASIEIIQQQGGTVEKIGKRGFRDLHELKDVYRVEFPGGIDDEKLTALIEPLSHVPRLDLNLSDAAITDVGIAQLWTLRKNLLALDLSGTPASETGLDKIYHLHKLEVLNLSGTRASDNSVSTAGMIGPLQVLLLVNTRTSDEIMTNLRIADQLKYVNVTGTRITPAGANILRGAVPGVIVEGAGE